MTRYTRVGFIEGLQEGTPLAVSVLPWGIAYGIAAQTLVSTAQGLAMSAYVYSGAAQLVVLEMWREPLAIASIVIAVLVVNARYLLQGMTLAPWLSHAPAWKRWGTLFFLSDGAWATSLRRFESGYDDVGHLLGTSVAVYVSWLFGSWLGLMVPLREVDPRAWGLDFAVSAAIIALAGARWAGKRSVVPWVAAALAALLVKHLLGGSWFMIVGGIVGALAGAHLDGKRHAD